MDMIVLQSKDKAELMRKLNREMSKYPYGGYMVGPLTQLIDGGWQLIFVTSK
jgi:hypothetical protein